ncbi:hypothetical protein ACJJTC_017832 [Scirpophaga incertulas]
MNFAGAFRYYTPINVVNFEGVVSVLLCHRSPSYIYSPQRQASSVSPLFYDILYNSQPTLNKDKKLSRRKYLLHCDSVSLVRRERNLRKLWKPLCLGFQTFRREPHVFCQFVRTIKELAEVAPYSHRSVSALNSRVLGTLALAASELTVQDKTTPTGCWLGTLRWLALKIPPASGETISKSLK